MSEMSSGADLQTGHLNLYSLWGIMCEQNLDFGVF